MGDQPARIIPSSQGAIAVSGSDRSCESVSCENPARGFVGLTATQASADDATPVRRRDLPPIAERSSVLDPRIAPRFDAQPRRPGHDAQQTLDCLPNAVNVTLDVQCARGHFIGMVQGVDRLVATAQERLSPVFVQEVANGSRSSGRVRCSDRPVAQRTAQHFVRTLRARLIRHRAPIRCGRRGLSAVECAIRQAVPTRPLHSGAILWATITSV